MAEVEAPTTDKAICELLSSYHELNSRHVDELAGVPSPLEFMRYVHKGRPFIVRGAIADWPAVRWSVEYLKAVMGDRYVSVANTPLGSVITAFPPPLHLGGKSVCGRGGDKTNKVMQTQ